MDTRRGRRAGVETIVVAVVVPLLLAGAIVMDVNGSTQRTARATSHGADLVFASNRDGDLDLHTVDADGGQPVLQLSDIVGEDTFPQFSPDGSQIAWSHDGNNTTVGRMWIGSSDGLTLKPDITSIQTRGAPAWSPAGDRIAFLGNSGDNDFDIHLVSPDGSGQVKLADTLANEGDPTWGSFGIAATRDNQIVIIDPITGADVKAFPVTASNLDAHPTEPLILFSQATGGGRRLGVLNTATGTVSYLTDGTQVDAGPSWSPDGSQIAFSRKPGLTTGDYDLYLTDPDGSAVIQLTSGPSNDVTVDWRPAGSGSDPVTINISETVTVTDEVTVAPAVTILVAETVTVIDEVTVAAPIKIAISESVTVSDEVTVAPPVTILVAETVTVTDEVTVAPPITILVSETIAVTDDVTVTPPITILVSETIAVTDDVTVTPPVTILVSETVTITDDVAVAPPIRIAITEAVSVADGVSVVAELPATVAGVVWADLDGDGTRDPGEPGLGGVTVFADDDADGIVDAGEPTAVTAADGSYTIGGLPPGPTVLRQAVPGGHVATSPTAGHPLTLASGDDLVALDFGNDPVAADVDGDGIVDSIDGTWASPMFDSDRTLVSDAFTNEHRGGTTAGVIADRGGFDLTLSDAGDGVTVEVPAAPASGVSAFEICDPAYTVTATAGTVATLTCGSLLVEVASGSVRVTLANGAIVTVPAGSEVLIDEDGTDPTVEVLVGSATVAVGSEVIELDAGDTYVAAAPTDTTPPTDTPQPTTTVAVAMTTVPAGTPDLGGDLPSTGQDVRRVIGWSLATLLAGLALTLVARRRLRPTTQR